jgi:hypothetical protein
MTTRRAVLLCALLPLGTTACDKPGGELPTAPDVEAKALGPAPAGPSFTKIADWKVDEGTAARLEESLPAEVIVRKGVLEWVWASPCALNGCTNGILLGRDGFGFATPQQFAKRPVLSEFRGKCAARWFDKNWDHCHEASLDGGRYGSAPNGGRPAALAGKMGPGFETILVRVAATDTAHK